MTGTVDHLDTDKATSTFAFPRVASPSRSDAATQAKLALVAGRPDPNGAKLGPFRNTFYSEIDVVDGANPHVAATPRPHPGQKTYETEGGRYQIVVDTSETPDLDGWVQNELMPVVLQWYPKIVTLLPSGWLVEGIADYVRWYLYEPQSRGAEIPRRNADRVNYDDSDRVSANFLNWVTAQYAPDIVRQLNAAAREGRYSDDLWAQHTGHALAELNSEWKKHVASPQK